RKTSPQPENLFLKCLKSSLQPFLRKFSIRIGRCRAAHNIDNNRKDATCESGMGNLVASPSVAVRSAAMPALDLAALQRQALFVGKLKIHRLGLRTISLQS